MWLGLALLSALFAALTSILAKVGIEGVNSNLATAIRTGVVLLMAWGMVFLTSAQGGIPAISTKSWLFLILSGLATGASWLCYYKALQLGEACKVVPVDKLSVVFTLVLAFVFLHEIVDRVCAHRGGNAADGAVMAFQNEKQAAPPRYRVPDGAAYCIEMRKSRELLRSFRGRAARSAG